jgi:hypothetical protein
MKTILCWFVLMLAPIHAQYKIYSDWLSTNESGVQYRWVLDDLAPRACTIQVRDTERDGGVMVRATVNYRNFKQAESVAFVMPISRENGESSERILVHCTFLDHVEVKRQRLVGKISKKQAMLGL